MLAAAAGAQPPPDGAPHAVPPAAADTADAPEPVPTLPDGTRRVRGRVVVPRDRQTVGVPGAWVTLHRVGRDAAGPLDSARTDAAGAFAITYRPRGDASAVYFVATSRGGVAYFGAPLAQAVVEGDAAELVVYDTTSAAGHVHATGRHLIVSRPGAGGARDVLEVFELGNDSSVTFVPADSGTGVWSTPLPPRATNFAVRESSDVPADGLVAIGGRAALMVPLAPGLKQVAFSYQLPEAAFPLRVPVAPGTGLIEVLLEEPQATASGLGLAAATPVALEGKTFRRFLAQNASAGGALDVAVVSAAAADAWPRYGVPVLLGVVGGAMAVALVAAGRRRSGGPAKTPDPAPNAGRRAAARSAAARTDAARWGTPLAKQASSEDRDRLLAELAALDDEFARVPAPTDAERAAYERQRAQLRTAVEAELAVAAPTA